MKTGIGRFLLVTCSAVLLGSAAAAAEKTVLNYSNWLPANHYVVTEMVMPWAEQVKELTHGRVEVRLKPALGKPDAHVNLVRTGVADLAFGVHGYTPGRFKLTSMAELPFLANDATINSVAYWDTYQKLALDANEHDGVKLLSLWTNSPLQLFVTSDHVKSMEDLVGKKIRVQNELGAKVAELLGMVPITAPASETYELLSQGVIDGSFFQAESIVAFKLDKLVKTAVLVPGGFAHSSQFLIMNQKKWDSISPEDQAMIMDISGKDMAEKFAQVWDQKENAAQEKLRAAGVDFIEVSGAELEALKEKLKGIESDWIKMVDADGVDGAEIMRTLHAEIEALQAGMQGQN